MFVNNSAQFISTIEGYLNQGGYYGYSNSVGAAFIIDFMLGRTPDGSIADGVSYAKDPANLATWENMVTTYGSGVAGVTSYWVNWSQGYLNSCGGGRTTNSSYSPDTGDDVIRRDTCGNIALPQIVFYWNNGASWFAVGKPCGNIQDNSQTPTPPINNAQPIGSISLTCNGTQQVAVLNFSDADGATDAYISTTNPANGQTSTNGTFSSTDPMPITFTIPASETDPYPSNPPQYVTIYVKDVGPNGSQQYVAQPNPAKTVVPCVTVSCAGGGINTSPSPLDPFMTFTATASLSVSAPPPPGMMMNLTITAPANEPAYPAISPAPLAPNGSATFANLPAAQGTGGTYQATWSVAGLSGSCNGTFTVTNLPYTSVYGGDVLVGGGPVYSGGPSVCGINSSAGIFGWNNHTTDFSGAGTEYALETMATIEDFASAQDSSPDAQPPLDLAFANTAGVNKDGGLFGGFLPSLPLDPNTSCNFTGDITTAPESAAQANLDLRNLVAGGPIRAGTTPTIIYATGNVYIPGNIVYDTSNWTNASQIPSFKLVVRGGNIYIGTNVTQLDGLYVAEPSSSGTNGAIYDCATGPGAPVNIEDTGRFFDGYTPCHQQLVVNGSFAGKQIFLKRTFGSVGAASGDTLSSSEAGEVFNYTPEMWLPRGGFKDDSSYTAITGLPPVL